MKHGPICVTELIGGAMMAVYLGRIFDELFTDLKCSTKLFMDETRAPVLDPGSRRTKTGYFRALARDDRPWSGGAPPGAALTYAPGRGGIYDARILQGYSDILQLEGYAGYNRLIAPVRVGADIQFSCCWAHARCKLVEITRPTAETSIHATHDAAVRDMSSTPGLLQTATRAMLPKAASRPHHCRPPMACVSNP